MVASFDFNQFFHGTRAARDGALSAVSIYLKAVGSDNSVRMHFRHREELASRARPIHRDWATRA
jgi:hypothetical protein